MNRRAFSLVELSVVLVILGLLTGGILAGRSLIRAAELRSVTTDIERYVTASHSFHNKYFGMPGDLPNATSFWGALGGNSTDNYTVTCGINPVAPNGAATCNGDGGGTFACGASTHEQYRFWQHLVNAGLIEGNYDGCHKTTCGHATIGAIIGTNVPPSKLGSTVYFNANTATNTTATTTAFAANDNGNVLGVVKTGSSPTVSDSYPFSPEELWNIDTKLDDGLPGTGRLVVTLKGDGANTFCTSVAGSTTDAGATYRLDITARDCAARYLRAFQ